MIERDLTNLGVSADVFCAAERDGGVVVSAGPVTMVMTWVQFRFLFSELEEFAADDPDQLEF